MTAGRAVAAIIAVGVVAGACAGGRASPASTGGSATVGSGPPSPSPSASASHVPGPSPTAAPSISPSPSATPVVASPRPTPAVPPAASIGEVRGELGSYTWDGIIADAPWIVAPTGLHVAARATLAVVFASSAAASWDAAWAPVSGDAAGAPTPAGSGAGSVTLAAPAQAGTWSLRLTARFSDGREATWFWRVAVGG